MYIFVLLIHIYIYKCENKINCIL